MLTLPASPNPVSLNLAHLKKQAKHLLRDAHAGDPAALTRFLQHLPAVKNVGLAVLAQHRLQLHDAQSVVAREYGFRSWTELKRYVEWQRADRTERVKTWLGWAYGPTFGTNARARRLAARMAREEPHLFAGDPWLACATGNVAAVQAAIASDSAWPSGAGGPLHMLPLIAVTHSLLILDPDLEAGLLACARLLLENGADVDSVWTNPAFPDFPLSALFGAAGKTHHVGMTRLLLEAGANPNDNESLYHSVEGPDSTITHLLLAAGARVNGTNALGRVLDYDKLDDLKLMLQHGGDGNDRHWLHHAILRGRSLAHIRALVEAGADLRAVSHEGVSVFRWAQLHGRTDVLALLAEAGIHEELSPVEQFIAACSRGDESAAGALLTDYPDIFAQMTPLQLKALPALAAAGNMLAVRTMLAVGWPVEEKTNWDATALNLAVFRGDPAMAQLLLDHGANWRTLHGYNDNVLGTLSYACQAESTEDATPCDYLGCARVLVGHGVPLAAWENYAFSSDIADYLDSQRLRR